MPDCEEQKFFAAGEQVGKPLPAPSCAEEQLRIPNELRKPSEAPIPEPTTSITPVLMLYNRQVTLTCQEVHPQETIYGEAVTVAQGAYSATYTLAALSGISRTTLDYITSEGLLTWIEEYLNTKAFGSMSVKQIAKKLRITNKQATQLINESIIIIDRLNDLALTNAGTQISCYWLNEAQSEDCPSGSVEGDNGLNPASIVAAGVVTSYLSQADANSRAKTLAREALMCHWVNDAQTASCAEDMGLPGVPNDLHPVYPGLEPRQGTVSIAAGSFSYAAKTPSGDVVTPEEMRQFCTEAVEEANRLAKDYALSLLVCYYVNPAIVKTCADATAGTVVSHTYALTEQEMESDSIMNLDKEAGEKVRYELVHREASFIDGTRVKGQRVFVPEGYIVSAISQEDATARAEAIVTSLLECCFINRAFEASCPPAQVLDSNGNPEKDVMGNDVYVTADDIPGARLTVEAGTFYSCESQAAVDAIAESSIEGLLTCAYCNGIILPACVPTWVSVAVTSGIVLGKNIEAWKKNAQDEWTKVEMHEGDTYTVDLPLDIKHLTNPYTGEDEDTTLWSEDATIGAPARYNCSSDINVSNQLAELYAVTKATDGGSVCEYKNKKVIVTCSGNDPFTQCPACKPSFPHDIEPLPEASEAYSADSAESVWPFVGWATGIDRTTGETFVFGSARGNFPWDDVESFPNCATYLTVEKGVYISYVSVEEATLMAQVFAVSLMNCVNTNPEIYLYCDMPDKPTVAIGTNWHPTPTGYLSDECAPRANWPDIACTCAAVLLDYGHDEDEGVYAKYTGGYIAIFGKQDIECSMPAVSQTLGDLYMDDCGNDTPMYKQYAADGINVEYGKFTVNGGYPQRIYMEPPVGVDYTTLQILDPTLRDSALSDTQKELIVKDVLDKKLAEIGAQDGLKKIVPWWAFAKDFGDGKISMYKDGILPSYVGPAPPYYGVTPSMGFAPGSNVMRVSEMPGNGKSWSEVVTENNPVIIAARTIRKKNSTNYACWKEARDLGLSMLYCQYCASGPVIIPTTPGHLVPCCSDPLALNYCEQKKNTKIKQDCSEDTEETTRRIPGGEKSSEFGSTADYPSYAPDCLFLGDTLEEAIEKRKCFVASVTRVSVTDTLEGVECWYGNDEKVIVKPCEQTQYRNKTSNNYLYWEEKTYKVPSNTVLSNISKASANAEALQMLSTFPAPVCIAQNDEVVYTPQCDKRCTNVHGAATVCIPEGTMISMQDTTLTLNSQIKAMLGQIISGNCFAVSQEFYMGCRMPDSLGGENKTVKIPRGLIIRKCDTEIGDHDTAVTKEAQEMAGGIIQCPICNSAQRIKCTTEPITYKDTVLYTPDFAEKNGRNIISYTRGNINACAFICPGAYTVASGASGGSAGLSSINMAGSSASSASGTVACTQEYMDKLAKALGASVATCMVENSSVTYLCNWPSEGNSVTVSQAAIILDAHEHTQKEATEKARAIAKNATTCILSNEEVVSPGCASCNNYDYYNEEDDSHIPDGSHHDGMGFYQNVNRPVIPQGTITELVQSVEQGHEDEFDAVAEANRLTAACRAMALSMQVCIASQFGLGGRSTKTFSIPIPRPIMSSMELEIPQVDVLDAEVSISIPQLGLTTVTSTITVAAPLEVISDVVIAVSTSTIEIPIYTFTEESLEITSTCCNKPNNTKITFLASYSVTSTYEPTISNVAATVNRVQSSIEITIPQTLTIPSSTVSSTTQKITIFKPEVTIKKAKIPTVSFSTTYCTISINIPTLAGFSMCIPEETDPTYIAAKTKASAASQFYSWMEEQEEFV